MKSIIFSLLMLFFVTCAQGQSKAMAKLLENAHNWQEGRIFLNDGTEIKGLVKFDDNSGLLTFQEGDMSRTFIAKTVVGFEVVDEQTGGPRVFISMQYDDGKSFPKYYFFELLKECKSFTVLSKVDPVEIETKRSGGAPYLGPGGFYETETTYYQTQISQTETVFLMDPDGAIKPYLQIVDREVDGLFGGKRTKNKFIDKNLLQNYMGLHYDEVEEFAEVNDLNLKIKSDLLKILDHYLQLQD